MRVHAIAAAAKAAAVGAVLASALMLTSFTLAHAQQQPTPAALAAAREIIVLKGGVKMFEPIVPGVIEQVKMTFLQSNPMLSSDLNEVAAALRAEYANKIEDITKEVSRLYATHFTEQELKDAAVFYKSPLGKKLIDEEPKIIDQSMSYGQNWANNLSDEVVAKIRAAMKKKGHDI